MTYQYITVEMVKAAKANGGFIDQKTFKTVGKYGFDSVILTDTSLQILEGYIHFVRPLLKPQCDFFFCHQKRKLTQQIGQQDEQVGLRRCCQIHSPHTSRMCCKGPQMSSKTTGHHYRTPKVQRWIWK